MEYDSQSLEKLTRYLPVAAAGNNPKQLGGSALEILVENLSGLDEPTKKILNNHFTTPEGVEKGMKIYSDEYEKLRNSLKIGELSNYYSDVLSTYADNEEVEILTSELGKLSDIKFGDLLQKITKASYIIKGEENGYEFNDTEKEDAIKTMNEYGNVFSIINDLEQIKYISVVRNIQERTARKKIKKMVQELKTISEQKKSA